MDTQSPPDTMTREAPEVIQLIEAVRCSTAIEHDLMATLKPGYWPAPRGDFAVTARNFLYRVKRAQEKAAKDHVDPGPA